MRVRLGIAAFVLADLLACGAGVPTRAPQLPLSSLRASASSSSDEEVLGRWALAEMLEPGGDAQHADKARALLEHKHGAGKGMFANLAVAVADEAHGDPRSAADSYVNALRAAARSPEPEAPLVAWFSTHHLLALRSSVAELYAIYKPVLENLMASPGKLGWRAVAELVEWSSAEAFDKAEATGDAYDTLVTERLGCARAIRLAGPFGHGSLADRRRAFGPEGPGPWPASWPEDPLRGTLPHVLKVEQHRCFATSSEHVEDGVFYAETFFTTPADRDLLIAVQGSVQVWVDDTPVHSRDLRTWGVWQKFGVALRVGAGRHRVTARLLGDGSSVRLLNLDGTPAGLATDSEERAGYSIVPPQVLADPNVIDGIVSAQRSHDPRATAGHYSLLEDVLASYLAHIESMDDVATVLIEPLVTPKDAAAVALEMAAQYAKADAAMPDEVRQRTEKDLRKRAVAQDQRLWYSRAWLILDDAEQRGLVEGIDPLRKLADEFPGEPEVLEGLSRLYGRLGWKGERLVALADLAKRFADDGNALRLYLEALDEDGPLAEADRVAARIKKLDPDSEVDLNRSLARQDWAGAIAELRKLGKRRPDRKEIAGRIADVLERAGDPTAAAEQLRKALGRNPEDGAVRLRLADRSYAKGDTSALRRALADALQVGAKGTELREALDLLEGATDLEPYRQDGRAVIREFEAWEKAGHRMEGTAARVLDYAAVWVHPDASSEMLEHEILRIQSQEAIGTESEQQPPTGLVLRVRVIKPDGSVLEPEPVEGKPTLSMPHLEIGDYVEIEHIAPSAGDGQKGRRFRGPHWFFREPDKGYWRSEFVTITPKDRALEIETVGAVPAPTVRDKRTFIERRWRVEESPPAPEEPDSPRPTEFLPSVRIGWGVTLPDAVARLVDVAADETPLDPRLYRKAVEIVKGVPAAQVEERARLVYQDVLAHVQDGNENDGRKVLLGNSGSRQPAFQHLLRQLGIPVSVALVKSRLAMPALGELSEVESYEGVVLRVETEHGVRWMTVRDKFAPFAYVPAELRGQPAIVLVPGTPRDATPASGAVDGVRLEGRATLHPDGSADVELVQSFAGKVGITMRNVLDKVAGSQLHDFIESRLLGRNLPGARLRDLKVENKDELSLPLTLHITAEASQLARVEGKGLVLKALFPMHLAQLAALPSRQTPLLLGVSSHVDVKFEIVVPESMTMPSTLPRGELKDGERLAQETDAVHGHAIVLERTVDIPAGRVQPGDDYAKFARFVQDADALLEREILIGR